MSDYDQISREINDLDNQIAKLESERRGCENAKCTCGHGWCDHYESGNHVLCDYGDNCPCKEFIEE